MKILAHAFFLLALACFAGCTGAPTTPQEAAADQRVMNYEDQQEQDTMDEDMGYDDPAANGPEVGENPIMDVETPN